VTAEDVLESAGRERPARLPRPGRPGPHAGRWVRWGALGAAALATMAVAGPPVPISTVRGVAIPPAGPAMACRPAPPTALTTPRLTAPPGLTLDQRVSACAGMHTVYYSDGHQGGASLLIYEPGALDTAPVRGDRKVRVGAHTGYLGVHPEHLTADPGAAGFRLSTLAWEYAPGAWALTQQTPRLADLPGPLPTPVPARFLPTALAIAATVRPDLPRVPVRVPVRLAYVPDGLALTSVDGFVDGARQADGSGTLTFGSADAAAAGCADAACLSRLEVQIHRQRHKFPIETYLGSTVRVGDVNGKVIDTEYADGRRQPTLTVFRGDWEITVSSDSHGEPVAVGELAAVARGARLPPSGTDPATWYTPATAIPD
jgi:hypothetical protein